MKEIIKVENLRKRFGQITAVDGISFQVGEGEIVGVLGPNGAGKTTTISMLLGLLTPDAGRIKIFGLDLAQNRQRILQRVGYADADLGMQYRLSVYENLFIFSMLFEVQNKKERILELLEELEISNLKDRQFEDLSSGQKNRVILCKALLNEPDLLLLDEPTAGLDPEICERVEDYLLKLRGARNVAMVYTSHNMVEVTRLCDRIIFINQGKIIAQDTPVNLTKTLKDTILHLIFSSSLVEVKRFCRQEGLHYHIPEPNHLIIKTTEAQVATILAKLTAFGIEITDIQIDRPDLKDVFIKLAREGKDVMAAD